MITVNRTPTFDRTFNFLGRRTLARLSRLVLLLAGISASLWSIPELRAAPALEDEEFKAAMQATIEVVRKHKACPTDPAAFDKFAAFTRRVFTTPPAGQSTWKANRRF